MKKADFRINVAVILTVVLVALGIMVVLATNDNYEKDMIRISSINEKNIQDAVNRKVKEGEINIQYLYNAEFEGKNAKEFLVRNIEENKADIVFTITDENGKLLYNSKALKRGYEIRNISLNHNMKKGTYDCSIKIGYADTGNVSSVFPLRITVV